MNKKDRVVEKYKIFTKTIMAILLSNFFSTTAFANSSWRWISETRPYDILPIVVLFTLAIETFLIAFATKALWYKIFAFVFMGNILSFVLPYIFLAITPNVYGYSLTKLVETGPYYTVGIAFLVITIVIELPFVYLFLRKDCAKWKLIKSIILSNVITTLLTAIAERIFCRGSW